MALRTAIFLPSRMKKRKYNPACVEDEVSISDMLSELVSGDVMNLETEGQSSSEESSNTSPESHHPQRPIREEGMYTTGCCLVPRGDRS
jgi:hypothetical protein